MEESRSSYAWKSKSKKSYLIHLWTAILHIWYILEETTNEEKNAYSYNLIVDRCKCNMDRLKNKCLHDQFGSLRTT